MAPSTRLPRHRRPSSLAGPLIMGLVATLVLGSCGGETTLPAPLESAERGSTSGAEPGGDFCGVLRELADQQSNTEDPAEVVGQLARAGDAAPKELRPAFAVLAGVAEQLGGLDPDSEDYFEKSFEIVMDPEVQEAADRIDEYASNECGVDLDEEDALPDDSIADDPIPDDTTPDDTIPGASGDIDLEHVDAILEEHKPAAWAEALNFTTVMNDTAVTLATGTPTGMSVTDALEACEAVRSALVSRNPDLTVEIRDGDTLLASSPTGGRCAAA